VAPQPSTNARITLLALALGLGCIDVSTIPPPEVAPRPLQWQEPTLQIPAARSGHAMATLGDKVILFGGLGVGGILNDTWEWNGKIWTKLAPPTSPPARSDHAMATLGDKILLFGGVAHVIDDGGKTYAYDDTWEWDGQTWTQLTPPVSPLGRGGHGMATLGNEVILFGGEAQRIFSPPGTPFDRSVDELVFLDDTWRWDGATWTSLAPTNRPLARSHHAMAALDDKVIVFGGAGDVSPIGDTWQWDGSTWARLAPLVSPPAQSGRPMTTLGDKILLFAGELNSPVVGPVTGPQGQIDVWQWNGASWAPVPPSCATCHVDGPAARADAKLATLNERVVLFGGAPGTGFIGTAGATRAPGGAGGGPGTQTATTGAAGASDAPGASGGATTPASSVDDTPGATGPAAPAAGDASTSRLGAGGADGSSGVPTADTWEWNGAGWLRRLAPPPSFSFTSGSVAMASLGAKIVLLDTPSNDSSTWEFDGTVWTRVAPSINPPGWRVNDAMAPLGDKVLMFGGNDLCYGLADTWQWEGATWTHLAPTTSPSARDGHAMASLGGKIILFGGSDDLFPGVPKRHVVGDTWEWDGVTWTQLAPATSPPARAGHAMTTVGNKIILFGGTGAGGVVLGDTWEWDSLTWALVGSGTNPTARTGHAMAALGQKVVLFGGQAAEAGFGVAETPLHDTWEWDGATWTQLAPLTYPTARSAHAMATLGDKVVLFGGINANDTWVLGAP
jgi:N-acetylneuraminic acid mutarotase